MNVKGLRILLIAVFFTVCGVMGAKAENFKMGYLDLSKTFDNYEKTKEYDAVLETDHKKYEEERNKKIEELREKQGKLAVLKEEEKPKFEEEIEALRAQILETDRDKKTEMTKQRDEKIREVLLEIEGVVSDFAKKEGYSMIFNDRVLVYSDEMFDVTDKVLKILNDGYTKNKGK
jgi:Skp family chaperone for outer membrane proteins